jgi:XrtJ-associated TM-motif-TM protein
LFAIVAPLQAQSGCTDSPENPTLVLALVGSAGAMFSTMRARLRTRRNSSRR